MAILMIHHIAGGAWGAVIRRPLESATRTIPLLALLFLPIALGVGHLYEWAHPEVIAQDPILAAKAAYLNVPFFLVRAVFYFSVWLLIAWRMSRWSLEQDVAGDPGTTRRLEMLSRVALVVYGLTVTFAAIDWVMSLEPHWFSMIFGLLVMGGQGLSAFAFAIPLTVLLSSTLRSSGCAAPAAPRSRQLPPRVRDDLGVPCALAAPDHLVGEPARGDLLVPAALDRRLERSRRSCRLPLRAAVLGAAVADAKQRGLILAAVGLWLIFGRLVESCGSSRRRTRPTASRCTCSTFSRRSLSAASGSGSSSSTSLVTPCCRCTIRLSGRTRREPRRRSDSRAAVLIGLGSFVVLIVLGVILPTWLEDELISHRDRTGPKANPLAAEYGLRIPPAPRLQVDPDRDLESLRAADARVLGSYGWVDPQAGVVRIPIERAMEIVAARAAAAEKAQP